MGLPTPSLTEISSGDTINKDSIYSKLIFVPPGDASGIFGWGWYRWDPGTLGPSSAEFCYSVLDSTPRIAIFHLSTISSLKTKVADKFRFNDYIGLYRHLPRLPAHVW